MLEHIRLSFLWDCAAPLHDTEGQSGDKLGMVPRSQELDNQNSPLFSSAFSQIQVDRFDLPMCISYAPH
jgi:hypothetical protein